MKKVAIVLVLGFLSVSCGSELVEDKRMEQTEVKEAEPESLDLTYNAQYKSFPSRWPANNPSTVSVVSVEWWRGKCYNVIRLMTKNRKVISQNQRLVVGQYNASNCYGLRNAFNSGIKFSGSKKFPSRWPSYNPSGVSVTNVEFYQGKCYQVVRRMSKSRQVLAQNQAVYNNVNWWGCRYLKSAHDAGRLQR